MPSKPRGRNVPPSHGSELPGLDPVQDRHFKGEVILLDGHAYRHCTFDDCVFLIAAKLDFSMVDCKLSRSRFEMTGAAALTLSILHRLYRGFGPFGQELVEETFNNIRNGPVPRPPTPES